jgi:hypothetical protein
VSRAARSCIGRMADAIIGQVARRRRGRQSRDGRPLVVLLPV